MALVVVLGVLLIVSTLAITLLTSAMNANGSTTHSAAETRALAAADAGLQAAVYRLSNVGSPPADTDCFTTVAAAPGGGACPTWTETTGNGTSYRYEVGPALDDTQPCAGPWVQTMWTSAERCVTSIGSAGGVERRVQQRVIAYKIDHLFPVNGMFARDSLDMSGPPSTVAGDIAANNDVKVSNGASLTGTIYSNATTKPPIDAPSCVLPSCQKVAKTFTVSQPDDAAFDRAQTSNDNAAIAWTNGWNAATRTVNSSNPQGPIDIPSGVYSFCRLKFSQTVTLTLAADARAVIYIDSPKRAGSTCPNGTGDVDVSGPFTFNNLSGNASSLQIFAYGDPGDPKTDFSFSQTVNSPGDPFNALVYAPNSKFTSSNQGFVKGALAANKIATSNVTGFTGAVGSALQTTASPRYFPTAWRECSSATPSGSGLGSGC